mmetsp:Transcript_4135/g.4617  ORF Transcript_4135/g.4617 Transcript_4135/m.4617 type:complete len:192 (+) Transcript_4135:159-734(+)|eukprot:CAMPEP_0170857630 /NCGR_PEP_ID=MMETSP0734-20130129/15403_1 /TAXON_ID=186038 /ORGANISM="Fragilariopsis kerguelensis, Strain L26-C5" /LENGTH=191 /DNA_ID=CAMNT_0011229897 /DNA_START=154 /DNA_END=729 /DNA_ORIENTATION=+
MVQQQQRSQRIINLLSLLLVETSAFSTRTVVQPSGAVRPSPRVSSPSALNVGAVWSDDEIVDDHDNDTANNLLLLNSASDCAKSETCSLEEARSYLVDRVQQIQRNENVDDAATEVVTHLRQKIDTEGQEELSLFRVTTTVVNVAAAVYIVYAILHDFNYDVSVVSDVVPTLTIDDAPMLAAFDEYQYTLF